MFLISFGFLCIFFGLFNAFESEFGSFIEFFLLLGFLKFFYDLSSIFWEFKVSFMALAREL